MLRYIGSLLFLIIFSNCGYSQSKYIPTAYRFGIDLTGIGYTFLGQDHQHYEINNDFQFGKYYFALDIGSVNRTYTRDNEINPSDNYIYQFSGSFFRTGIDYNFIPKDPDDNVIFIGARYGRAYFSDNLQFTVEDNIFGDESYRNSNEKLRGRWLEANAGMKIRVWNQFFLGYTIRMKFARKVKGETNLAAYEVPGYGNAAKNNNFGFNYHVFYRIPL